MSKIGVFDSGLGGLCAVREIRKVLSGEDIIYFGDTGRVPYGNKSCETIRKYGQQSVNFLREKNVDIILAACGTVSSVALGELQGGCGVPVLGIIEGACEKAVRIAGAAGNKKIGVIGTQATVASGAFEKYIKKLDGSCEVYARACPLFVPLVENGHIQAGDMIAKLAAEKYLADLRGLGLACLILGCTHYPMLKDIIGEAIGTELIDAGAEAAHKLKRVIGRGSPDKKPGALEIFISDEGMCFSEIASGFLGFDIKSGISKINIENY